MFNNIHIFQETTNVIYNAELEGQTIMKIK